MRTWLRNSHLVFLVALATTFVSWLSARAAEPMEIRWEQLIPASRHQSASRDLVSKILPHRQTTGSANMSVLPQSDLVFAYDRRRVRITGFVLPFNNDEPPYKRLLLIPFSGACVKFPPPRNQAILIEVEKGIRLASFVDLVAVSGVMSVTPAETDIAKAGYRIDAETIVLQD